MTGAADTRSLAAADGDDHRLDWFQRILRIRLVEEEIAERYGEQRIRCPVHLSIGQEAVPIGVSAALRVDDQIVSSHRCHAHYLAKGGDLRRMLCELMGKADGCCGGRGGSMHLFDTDAGVLVSLPIVAASIPVGIGAALAMKQQNSDSIGVVYLGDAAIEEGVFHESANFAAVHSLPAVFVCENNLYSVYTPLNQRQPDRPLSDIGEAHGMPSITVDGNDVGAVFEAAVEAVSRARSGGGPTFLLADTYRWREHCGPKYDNHIGYRTEAEFEEWKGHDPLTVVGDALRAERRLDAGDEAAMRAEIKDEIDAAFAYAEAAPYPDPDTAGARVYA